MPIDFGAETTTLTSFTGNLERKPWFSPGTGTYQVTFKSDGNEYTTEYGGETINKVRFDVIVNGGEFNDANLNWGIAKGKTFASTWGQIALLGKVDNTLIDKTFTVVVTMGNGRRHYQILEAVDLIAAVERENAATATPSATEVAPPSQ